jgi:hypothetical protein
MTPWHCVTSLRHVGIGDQQLRTIALHLVHLATRHHGMNVKYRLVYAR